MLFWPMVLYQLSMSQLLSSIFTFFFLFLFFPCFVILERDLEAISPFPAGLMVDFANIQRWSDTVKHWKGKGFLSCFWGAFLPLMPLLPATWRKPSGAHSLVSVYRIAIDSFLGTRSSFLAFQ